MDERRRAFLRKASLLGAVAPGLASQAGAEAVDSETAAGQEAAAATAMPALASGPPPQEHAFPDYHLLGNADPVGNLLGGGARPRKWKDTKTRVVSGLSATAHASDPIHDWIKTFLPGFEERSSAIVLGATSLLVRPSVPGQLRYDPELFDMSLRSASVQLDRCLRYRNEMGSFEISGVNAGISYLAFLKSKPIQRNLIMQSSSADIDELVRMAEARTGGIYARAHGLGRIFEKYHLLGLRSDAEGAAIEADFAEKKERLRTHLLEKQFHIQVDAQLAELTRLLSPGSASDFAERYLRILNYLTEDLADVYCKLYSVSKGVQQVLQITSMPMSGGGTIGVDIPNFTSLPTLTTWVQQVVPAGMGGQREPDIMDGFVIWSRALMRELNRRNQYESELTVAIPLSQPSGRRAAPLVTQAQMAAAFAQANPTGQVSFTLDPSVLPFSSLSSDLRVVGVGLTVERSQDDLSPVQFTAGFANAPPKPVVGVGGTPSYDPNPPPALVNSVRDFEGAKVARLNATLTSPPQTTPGIGSYQRPGILLANVRIQGGVSGDLEPALSSEPACHNLNPFGNWNIQMDPNAIEYYQSAAAIKDSWITGLIMYLRLRGTVV
jgi:hypothetical protein